MLLASLAGCADDEPRTRVAALTAEPDSAKFQSVRDRGTYVCGEVNGKERQGGYSGYRRFVYDRRKEAAIIDPVEQNVAAPPPNADTACAKVFAYQTVEERLTCAYAPAQQAGSDRQRQFETLWVDVCDGERVSNADSALLNPDRPPREGDGA